MSETKDQTIARLEGEVGRYGTELVIKLSTIARLEGELKEANSEVERYRGNYRASQQELAASREMGPCGKHPKMFWKFKYTGTPKGDPGAEDQWHCTLCAELAASRADALERAAEISDCPQDMANQTATRICTRIRGLITPTDDTARAERDKAMRPIGLCIERLPDWSFGAFLDNTEASCIAIGQTEEDALKNGTFRLIDTYRNQTERDRRIADDAVIAFVKEFGMSIRQVCPDELKEHDRRIRLEEHEKSCQQCSIHLQDLATNCSPNWPKNFCARHAELRAPVPAERAGDAKKG